MIFSGFWVLLHCLSLIFQGPQFAKGLTICFLFGGLPGMNRKLGLNDEIFTLFDSAILSALGRISMMPTLVLAARLCPEVFLSLLLHFLFGPSSNLMAVFLGHFFHLFYTEFLEIHNIAWLLNLQCRVLSLIICWSWKLKTKANRFAPSLGRSRHMHPKEIYFQRKLQAQSQSSVWPRK